MAYLPPHLRQHKENPAPRSPAEKTPGTDRKSGWTQDPDVHVADAILMHFWPEGMKQTDGERVTEDRKCEPAVMSPVESNKERPAGHKQSVKTPTLSSKVDRSTLNASAETPDQLAFILLHIDANPQFYDQGLIFVKSHFHLLKSKVAAPPDNAKTAVSVQSGNAEAGAPVITIKDHADPVIEPDDHTREGGNGTPHSDNGGKAVGMGSVVDVAGLTIPVFDQATAGPWRNKDRDTFRFIGYFTVDDVKICAPHSDELKELLEKKWTRYGRNGEEVQVTRDTAAWQKTFNQEWAQLRLVEDEDYERKHGKLVIKRLEYTTSAAQGEGVNDMLKDMRLNDGKA